MCYDVSNFLARAPATSISKLLKLVIQNHLRGGITVKDEQRKEVYNRCSSFVIPEARISRCIH